MDANGMWYGLVDPPQSYKRARILIIGAGSRGHAYARAIDKSAEGIIAAVAEPIEFKRTQFGKRYIWQNEKPAPEAEFSSWQQFLKYEQSRRKRKAAGEVVAKGIDAVFVCTLDEQHAEIIIGLAPLNLHIMCEKPLATRLDDCLDIYSSLLPEGPGSSPRAIFGIGHVLRYSPHNMLLRQLALHDAVIGEIFSIEHTEPVGWWHFSHSYVRGNWRKESTTAPSLLTKSCHDIDFLLWMLCSPTSAQSSALPHLPSQVTSIGHLNYFKKSRKPADAGSATNCLACPIETSCIYSAKKIYVDRHLRNGRTDWPVKIVNPEIEECYNSRGVESAAKTLLETLAEDYDAESTPTAEIDARPWFGRCVWESRNDVCDDQIVTLSWDDEPHASDTQRGQHAKTAVFHMIAHTEAQCERRGRIYGTKGEISYDSKTIRIFDFASGRVTEHQPHQAGGGHGGGDAGLAWQFLLAVEAVMNGRSDVNQAQREFLGCTVDETFRSHAMVFAAEEARNSRQVVDWTSWWKKNVEGRLGKGDWVHVD